MQDTRDTQTNQYVKNFSKKPRLKNRWPIKNASGAFSSEEEETMVTAPSDQAQDSESDSYEDHLLSDSHDSSAAKYKTVQIKEEYTSSEEDDMANSEEDDVAKSEEDDMAKSEEDDSEEDDVAKSEEDDMAKSEEDDVAKSEEDDVAKSEEDDVAKSEVVILEECPTTQCERSSDALKRNIGRSKEIPEDLRRRIIEAHKNGKGYKKISKDLDLPLSTVKYIVCKWKKFSTVATRPRSGRPTKISARARRTILKHMTENPIVKAKDLKTSLALDNINVHESTIRRTLNKWCSWDFTMEETTALQKE